MNRLRLLPAREHRIAGDVPRLWYGLYHRALGIILVAAFAPLLPHIPELLGASGLFDTELLRLHPHSAGLSVYELTALLDLHLGLSADLTAYVLAYGYLAASLALIAGRQVQGASVTLLLLHYLFFIAVPVYSYGFDFGCLSALFYCAIHPLWRVIPTLRLLQLHLCVIYLFGGLNKAVGSTWHNGEALWKAVQQPIGEPLIDAVGWLPLPWLWAALGWGVMAAELSYAVLIWWRPTRPWILGIIVLMHTGIALLLGLYAFSALMILLNLTAFYYPYLEDSPCPPSAMTAQTAVPIGGKAPKTAGTPTLNTSSETAGVPAAKPP